MRFYNRVVLMHRKQIWQPWIYQVFEEFFIEKKNEYRFHFEGRSMLNYATEHIPHVVWGIPFAAFCKRRKTMN